MCISSRTYTAGIAQVILLYSGEPLSDRVEKAYLNAVRKVIPFYLIDPVFQFSQTGYQTEGMSL